jgi:hypothetical protein
MANQKTITLGELRHNLTSLLELPDDTEITFGGGNLSFYRFKNYLYRADDKTPQIVNLEFNELFEVTMDPNELE